MKTLKYSADMGSVKVFSKELSLFLNNGIGDGSHTVKVYGQAEAADKNFHHEEFLGHFTVKQAGKVHISAHDCSDSEIYTFTEIGRYFCCLDAKNVIHIVWTDGDVHA